MRAQTFYLSAALLAAWISPALSHKEAVLYSFQGGDDGASPGGSLIDIAGVFYGTTAEGGSAGLGTVFRIDPSTGNEAVLHTFLGSDQGDGGVPNADLIEVGRLLYGTTEQAGGTIFSVDPVSDVETVVYSFGDHPGGTKPYAGLLDVGGVLYGTTEYGGTGSCGGGCGTVFGVTPKGTSKFSYAFQGPTNDGAFPVGPLIYGTNSLYGTTSQGGMSYDGTAFAVSVVGKSDSILHSFQAGGDGDLPESAGLLAYRGKIYGTTPYGGVDGGGTVFSLDPSKGYSLLYSFQGGSGDAEGPQGALIAVKGKLYGTSVRGGAHGCGSVFSITPSGQEDVVYSFQEGSDGCSPSGRLLYKKGFLYGTTQFGGTSGNGTVFRLGL